MLTMQEASETSHPEAGETQVVRDQDQQATQVLVGGDLIMEYVIGAALCLGGIGVGLLLAGFYLRSMFKSFEW